MSLLVFSKSTFCVE